MRICKAACLISIVIVIIAFFILPNTAYTEIPKLINYQGYLVDKNTGMPVNGLVDLSFSIYDAQTGGSFLGIEHHYDVPVQNGIFNVILGSSFNLANLAFDKPYYLGIKVEDDEQMIPRQQLTSAAYALGPWRQQIDKLSYNTGPVGIGTSNPGVKLHIDGGTDVKVGYANTGYAIIGSSASQHIAIDDNEIMSKGGGGSSAALYIQNEGGITYFGGGILVEDIPIGTGVDVQYNIAKMLVRESSSRKYKENIRELDLDSGNVFKLQPVRFNWKGGGEKDIGLIAEDVEKILPELVIYDREGRPDAVKYNKLAVCLLKTLKVQQQRISALEKEVAQLRK